MPKIGYKRRVKLTKKRRKAKGLTKAVVQRAYDNLPDRDTSLPPNL